MSGNMKLFGTILLMSALLTVQPLSGQTYRPDTSLTYSAFLKQCQYFTQRQRKEVWVVNFWASWNGASLYTLPQLKALQADFRLKPVRFVSISVDKRRSYWEQRLPQYELPWEQLFLPDESDYEFLKTAFRHNSLPAIFLVNAQGQIRRMRDVEDLRQQLTQAARTLPDEPYQPVGETVIAVNDPVEVPEPEAPRGDENGAWITHKVENGETLYSLYRRYGVPVEEIRQNNGMTGNTIKVGQVLKIKPRKP
ncbi:MAG: LysM peptidoglycan-binding domain-containing protein [Bacteroidetes bacterium]|nr:MAG: LysM peptidoglycan-binding domain-containing protein [Bacteroidota bacterium]